MCERDDFFHTGRGEQLSSQLIGRFGASLIENCCRGLDQRHPTSPARNCSALREKQRAGILVRHGPTVLGGPGGRKRFLIERAISPWRVTNHQVPFSTVVGVLFEL